MFCSADMLALSALIEAKRRGIDVPGRLAVVGLGDQGFAADATPPLTTVRIDGTRIGALAAQMVFARSEGRAVEASAVDIGFAIVERENA